MKLRRKTALLLAAAMLAALFTGCGAPEASAPEPAATPASTPPQSAAPAATTAPPPTPTPAPELSRE